ncbi:MAG: hypothetical protein OK457_03575 [Thaumarchaeota archaeon]|nr:hypothetical protein [Nitrososphaerota archaeon]
MINTVLGLISAKDMGATLCHEHCFIEADFWAENPEKIEPRFKNLIDEPVSLANMSLVSRAGSYSRDNQIIVEPFHVLKELRAFRAAGGKTVVDCTVDGIGRERHHFRLPELSKLSGVNIIVPTGYYVGASHPEKVKNQSAEAIAQDFVKDISEGIHGTTVKAGVIGEIGVSPGEFKDDEKKVVLAAVIAQRETKVPLTIHTWGDMPGKWMGFGVIDFLQKNDADFDKVYMSHIDWTVAQENDWGCALKAAKRGVYLSLDNFGNEWPYWSQDHSSEYFGYIGAPTDLDRIACIRKLVDEGYEDRIVVGHDLGQKLRLKTYGGHGLDHISTNVKALFDFSKLNPAIFKKLTEDNPQKLFA